MRHSSTSQPQGPKVQSIGSLVSELISRRGYAQIAATSRFHEAISKAVGPNLAAVVTVGKLNRGVLKVFADDSVTIQELTFQKRAILKSIQDELPDANVTDLRFAVLTR
jgi:predicted nucleic acid-binding Zn ribbon protein